MNFKTLALIFSSALLLSSCSFQDKTPAAEADNAMAGFPCHFMANQWMGDCVFDEDGNPILDEEPVVDTSNSFSQDIAGLPEAKPSEIVNLKDGDRYVMKAYMVKQEVGNKVIKRLAYNGQIPGPLLKVAQNAEITLELENQLDVDTTLHSHGLRLDNKFDGIPDVTQKPIKPGESFTYKLLFPDEGIYWYHPHIREDYTQELGLYGNMLVEPSDPDYWAEVDREEVLIFDDMLITEDQPVFDKDHTSYSLMGRFGNIMLLNNEEDFQMRVKQNEVIRFYLTNVANTRHFNIQIPGVQLKLVGSDVGRIEKEEFINSTLIAPAERWIVEAQFTEKGRFEIIHKTPDKTYRMGEILVDEAVDSMGNFGELRTNASDYAFIRSDVETYLNKAPDKSLRISIDMPSMDMMMDSDAEHVPARPPDPVRAGAGTDGDKIEWEDDMPQMNALSNSETVTWKLIDEDTGKENMDINWSFSRGDLVKVRIFNDPESMHPMQHPIHFHGQRFVVLARDGEPNNNFTWKDTSLIQTGETVDILVEMSNPGSWMTHCHIAEHLHSGMMFGFKVK